MFFRLLALSFALSSSVVLACDSCAPLTGQLNNVQDAFGVKMRYRSFNGYSALGHKHWLFPSNTGIFSPAVNSSSTTDADHTHSHTHPHEHVVDGSPYDLEVFRTYLLWGRYNLSEQIYFQGYLPYRSVSFDTHGEVGYFNGLGDVSIAAGYNIKESTDSTGTSRLSLQAEVRLPTGKNDLLTSSGNRGTFIHQPGMGAFGFGLSAIYQKTWIKWAVRSSATGIYTQPNEWNEQLAASMTSDASLTYKLINTAQLLFIRANTSYQFMYGEIVNDIKTSTHRTNILFAGAGVQWSWNGVGATIDLFLPAYQNGDQAHTAEAGLIEAGLFYQFQ